MSDFSISRVRLQLFNPARYPFSYYKNGEASGILVDIFKKIASGYGLPYEFADVGSIDEYYDMRDKGAADVVLDFSESTDRAETSGYRLTSSYADSACSEITATDYTGTVRTVAVIDGSGTFYDIVKQNNPKAKVTYYDSFDDCVKAVESGAADCTYTYSVTAQMFVIEDNKNRIKATQLNDSVFQFRMAIGSNTDMMLYGLLNKAAHSVSYSDTEEITNSYLLSAKRSYTLWDYFTENPVWLIVIAGAILTVLISFILIQKRNSNRLRASNDALNESRGALEEALEAANEANAAKTKFLSQMSHDIRTPLNGIIGMTRIAGENANDPVRVKDSLEKISYSSDHLLTLINDILDLNRIESGKMIMSHEPADLRHVIEECMTVLNSSVINRDLEVTAEVATMRYPFVLTDALHLRQILINIISNAVKFTPDGGKITFKAGEHDSVDGGRTVVGWFVVSDTGIGMSEDFRKHIFESFVQADGFNARTQYKGSGLGMAIVKEFVDMLNGKIEIKSEPDKGTSVLVELPFDVDSEAEAVSTKEISDSGEGRADFTGARVLLAEDNEINIEIAQIMLQEMGIIFDTARNGQAAVDRFISSDEGEYQCILMDIMMPVMNGFEATKAIRALNRPDAKTVPIIAMTANAFAEDVNACLACGMNAHIAKPIDMNAVAKTLGKFIQR